MPCELAALPGVACDPEAGVIPEFESEVEDGEAEVEGEVELTPFDVPWFVVPVWLFMVLF